MGAKKRRTDARVTISDVAQKAGVSRTAVSLVLNEHGERNKYVSEETRAKVWQAARELHYQPNLLAKALRTGRSLEVAGITDVSLTLLGLEVMAAFQQTALQYGYMPTAYYSQGLPPEKRQELYQRIFARRPLAIMTTPFHFTEEDVKLACANGVEHILFYSFAPVPIEGVHSLVIPTREPGYLAARHLLSRGYRHLVLVQPDDPLQAYPFQERLEGMRAAIAEHPDATQISLDIFSLKLSAQAASMLVEAHLLQRDQPLGIYAFNDEYAFYLSGALTQHGVPIPKKVGIVGTDNLPFCEGTWPSLTSISLDGARIGQRCAELLHVLHQGLSPSEDLVRLPTPYLVQRGST